MINFRFHLVSLIAVFLALGLGILVGSTVIDQGIVNRLDSEINGVRKENSARETASKQLGKQNSQLQQFVNLVAPFAGDARLDGQSIALVAEQGINSDAVRQTEQTLQQAGADVPAVLWLDDPWRLDSKSRVQALESALDVRGTATHVRNVALNLLVRRLAKAPTSTHTSASATRRATKSPTTLPRRTTTTTPSSTPSSRIDVLTALEKAGFISVTDGDASAFAGFPAHPVDVLEVTGDDSDFDGTGLTAAFARAAVNVSLPTAVAAVYDAGDNQADAPARGASLSSILDDNVLSHAVSTVDDLDEIQGQIAAVLTLETIGGGNVGHYGYGTGASAPLPPHGS
ncbi:MAG: copper transporter [Acidimicrobiia bacterium]